MNRIFTILLLCFATLASAQLSQKAGESNQNMLFNGMVTVNRGLVLPVSDTGLVSSYFLAPYWVGARKEGALGWGGANLYVYRSGAWRCLTCSGGSGGGSDDGNNYPTSLTFNAANGQLTLGRQGLSSLTTSLEGRYALQNHTQPISTITGLPDSITALNARIAAAGSGGTSAYAPKIFNILEYGAIPNGANNSTTRAANSAAILNAYTAAFVRGAGKVFIPAGKYYVNPMDLPAASNTTPDDTTGWRSVSIEGESLPPFLFGTVGSAYMPKGGSIIECPNQTAGESIFYQAPKSGYFSGNIIKFANLELRTYNQPQIAAIHAGWAGQLIVENCQISTGVYSVQASVPNMNVAIGVVTPYINNNALTILDNVQVSGYYVGVQVNEHTRGDYLNLTCNLIGLEFAQANHLSYFGRVTFQRNQIGVRVTGTHYFDIAQMNIEHPAPAQTDGNNSWQLALYDFDDQNNYAIGSLTWGTTVGNVGPAGEFFKRGGANFCTHRIGTPPCVDTTSIPGLNASLAAVRASVNGKLANIATITINGDTKLLSSNPTFSIATGSGAPDSNIYASVKRVADSMAAARALIDARVKYADTPALLAPYARTADIYTRTAADARYLQTFTEIDPTVPSYVKGITSTNISNWNTAYGWGNHAAAGYLNASSSLNAANITGAVAVANGGTGATSVSTARSNLGLGNVDNTSDANKPVSTAQQAALDLKANLSGATFTGPIAATNLSGTNTGDQTNITGNAGTVTTIAGKVVAGTNMTRTGSGTTADPYVFNSTASGGGGGSIDSATLYRYRTVKWGEIMSPNTTTATLQNSGGWIGSASVSGTSSPISQYSQSNASLIRSTVNTSYACSTVANSFAGVYVARTQMYRSNNSVGGGYYFYYEFADSAFNSDSRLFVGTTAALAGTPVTSNPSALVNSIGFGKDAGDTYPSIFSNDGTGTATKTPLPTPTAINTSAIYKVEITCPRNVSYCRVKVVENTWSNGAVTLFDDNITSDLPTPGVFVGPYGAIGNGSNTTSQITFNFIKMRGETE